MKNRIFTNTTIHNNRKIRPNGSIRVLYESLSIVNVGYDLVKLYVLEWHYRIFELEGEVLYYLKDKKDAWDKNGVDRSLFIAAYSND